MHKVQKVLMDLFLPETLSLSNYGLLMLLSIISMIIGAFTAYLPACRFGAIGFILSIIICICIPVWWRHDINGGKNEKEEESKQYIG